MTTKIRILGWKIQGFRCPDHALDFTLSRDETFDISLVQMPNGTGKTTTLELLRMTLSGKAVSYSPDELRAFGSKDTSTGTCEVTLGCDGKLLTIILRIDLNSGIATYKTTWGSGQQNGFRPPLETVKFLNQDFIDYFILDGELAQQLLSNKQAAAQRVIDAMFQADTLKKVAQRIEQYWHGKANDRGATTPQGFTRRKNLVDELEGRLKLRRRELAEFQAKLKKLTTARQEHLDTFESSIRDGKFKDEALTEADVAFQRESLKLQEIISDTFSLSAHPFSLSASFASACMRLKKGLDRVKLPEAAAREFFEELCDESDCICGRPIDISIASIIRSRASQYLGTDDVSLLNSIKTAIDEELPGKDVDALHSDYKFALQRLSEQVAVVQSCEARFNELKVRAGESDPAVKNAIQTIEDLGSQITNVQNCIDAYTDPDDVAAEYNPSEIAKRLEKAKGDLAEVSNTLDLKRKTEMLCRILEQAYDAAAKAITAQLVSESNVNLDKWLPNNDIRIDDIRGHLLLRGGQAAGSVGENLSVAYAFLATLFNRSTNSLPFIVDSPAGSLGLPLRREIGKNVPNMSGQFISFVISTERQGFVDGGLALSGKKIQYLTVFRRRITDLAERAEKFSGSNFTTNGVIVEDEAFFNSFELEQE